MELSDVFGDLDLALATYRHAVSAVIPELTRVAWHLKKDELAKAPARRHASASSSTTSPAPVIAKSGTRNTSSPESARVSSPSSFGFCPRSGRSKRCRSSRRRRKPPLSSKPASTARSMSIADCWPTKALTASRWKIAISIPATPRVPANTASPTIPTPSWRASSREKDPAAIDPALLQQRPRLSTAISNSPTPPRNHPKDWQQTLAALDKLHALCAQTELAPCAILEIQPQNYPECSPIRKTTITVSRSRWPTSRTTSELRPTSIPARPSSRTMRLTRRRSEPCRTPSATR